MMLKRPQSPSNIPAPIKRDGSSSSIPRSSPRTPRKLPQAVIPAVPKKKGNSSETRIPTPLSTKNKITATDDKTKDGSRHQNQISGYVDGESPSTGVVYITENMIRRFSKEDNFHRVFKLGLTMPRDLNKKIKYIENLDVLKNLQILSIAHNSIEKMEKLDKLLNLQILDLSDNLLKKIEGIENLQQLTVLNVEDNLIENIPGFVGKKLKCLRTFKIARNQLTSLHELYKLRSLPDLVEVTTEENPMCSLPHERQITTFLLRSLEILNGDQITDKDRIEADERFQQDEIHRLEVELEKTEKKLEEFQNALEKSEQLTQVMEQNDVNLKKNNKKLKEDIGNMRKEIETKNELLESKTKELSKACEKQFKLEQELAFYKLDTKFDEFWKFDGYVGEEEDDEYIDEDQSAYIGKARFKPNAKATERILPSKAQMINFIKFVKRKDENSDEINKTIIEDLEEALNIDLKEKQNEIAKAEDELVKLRSEKKKMETIGDISQDDVDAPRGLAGVVEREKMREALSNLIQQAKEMQGTIAELQDKMAQGEQLLLERDEELRGLKEQLEAVPYEDPEQEKLMDAIAAKEEQCHQLEEYIEQLTSLLSETENELTEKAEAIRALEKKLKVGEATVQQEMKQGLEEMVKKLTDHCEDLKRQMLNQKKLNNDLSKERDFLKRKIEQLEDDVGRAYENIDDVDGIRNNLIDKENALREEMEMNDKLKDAYEKLLQKVNKKKRHVGIGSHDVWRDPHVEKLKEELNYTEDELARLKQELERMKKQREAERRALEQRLEEGQSKLDEAVQTARNAGDFKREAKELDKQLKRLQAEKASMKERLNELEEDLERERDDSIPWKNLLKYLQALSNDVDTGELERVTPIVSNSPKDKRLHRAFDDLRDKINDHLQRNEEEKEAKQRQLEKLHAKIEQLHDDYGKAQLELSKTRQGVREAEQELQDTRQQLDQTQNRLRNALNDRSNSEKLVKDELDALQDRLDEFQRTASQAKREANELRSRLEEAERKMRAVEQLAKEAEMDYENAKEEVEDLRGQLRKANNDKNAQAKADRNEIERLGEILEDVHAAKEQADKDNANLKEKLNTATKRMSQAENRAKQLEHDLDLALANVEEFQKEIEALKKQQKKDKSAFKERLVSAREKFERMQKGFENEINTLKNELSEGDKHISNLKEQLKKTKDDFTKELEGLAEEIAELQAEVLKKESQFQQAEENNNRLLDNLAKIEDENSALNDRLHLVEKQASDAIERERMLHANELRELEDEIDNLKNLISRLQLNYESKAYEHERDAVSSLSHEIDKLRQKVIATEEEAAGRERHHLKFKQRLSDEINKLQHAVENKGYEERLLQDKNRIMQQNLQDDIENLLNQISNLKRTLGYRERELSSLRDSSQPLIAHYKARINNLLAQLQSKEEELNELRLQLKEMLNGSQQTKYLLTNEPRMDNFSNQLEAVKNSVADLRGNVSYLLSSLPRDAETSHQVYTPLRPSVLKVTHGQSYEPAQGQTVRQGSTSPIHHHHYGGADELPLETIISSSTNMGNGSVHVHHHNNKGKSKKKRKDGKKSVSYDDDDDQYCNIPEHETMDNQMTALESRLRNSTLSRSKLSDDSPLKLELKQLQNKVEDAITRRHRLRQLKRNKNQTSSL